MLLVPVIVEFLEGAVCTPGKDEDGFAQRVCNLPLLESSVLHGGEKVLEPVKFVGVKLVPEDDRGLAGEHLVAHLMKCADQVGGAVELGEIEFKDGGLGAKDADGDLLQAEGFSRAGRAEDSKRKRLIADLAVLVHQHQAADGAQ